MVRADGNTVPGSLLGTGDIGTTQSMGGNLIMGIKTILECDCGQTIEFLGPYHTVKGSMKAGGWRNVNTGSKEAPVWTIRCPKCAGK
jgi:hypothetical protein